MKKENLSLSNKVAFLEKENYEYHTNKESLNFEITNFKKKSSYKEKV